MRYKRSGHVKGIVSDLIKKLEKTQAKKGEAVIAAWIKATDERTKKHAKPVNFKNGIITVIVENSSWLYELTLEKKKILERFNEVYTGRKKANNIRFRVGSLDL